MPSMSSAALFIDVSVDESVASDPSVAAKLRQLIPRLESRLHEGGWAGANIRVKVEMT